MATFEHKRYPHLTLQDDKGIWAQFTPEDRVFGEHTITVGVFETTDAGVIKRLRTAKDEDLVEVKGGKSDEGDGGK